MSVQTLTTQLQAKGDFLALTCQHENTLPAFTFTIKVKSTGQVIKANVLETGIICFEPQRDTSKDIVLSSAIHGNETAPIEICAQFIQRIILGEFELAERVLFIFGNPPAINKGERFIEENLNRLFSGGHSQDQGQGVGLINQERHRALLLENTVRDFFEQGEKISCNRERFHYDLHTAIRASKKDKFAVYPFRHGKPWVKEQLQFMLACGINTILLSGSPTTTFSYFSSHQFNAHAFTVELGKVRPFGENNMDNFRDIINSLTKLLSAQPLKLLPYCNENFSLFTIYQVINRSHEHFVLHFADDVENFTSFPVGTIIATDGDKHYQIEKEGEAIIFPNANVAIGQRALLTVIPSQLD